MRRRQQAGSRHRSLAIIAGSRPGASSSATFISRYVIPGGCSLEVLRRPFAIAPPQTGRRGRSPLAAGEVGTTAFMPMRLR